MTAADLVRNDRAGNGGPDRAGFDPGRPAAVPGSVQSFTWRGVHGQPFCCTRGCTAGRCTAGCSTADLYSVQREAAVAGGGVVFGCCPVGCSAVRSGPGGHLAAAPSAPADPGCPPPACQARFHAPSPEPWPYQPVTRHINAITSAPQNTSTSTTLDNQHKTTTTSTLTPVRYAPSTQHHHQYPTRKINLSTHLRITIRRSGACAPSSADALVPMIFLLILPGLSILWGWGPC